MPQFVKVANAKGLSEKSGMKIEAGGKQIALFKVDGKYYAIDDACTHRGGPLSEGVIEGTQVTCPWHGAKFDLTTGKVLKSPARADAGCYKVSVEGEDIAIEIP